MNHSLWTIKVFLSFLSAQILHPPHAHSFCTPDPIRVLLLNFNMITADYSKRAFDGNMHDLIIAAHAYSATRLMCDYR